MINWRNRTSNENTPIRAIDITVAALRFNMIFDKTHLFIRVEQPEIAPIPLAPFEKGGILAMCNCEAVVSLK
jgi:hypothetical protein